MKSQVKSQVWIDNDNPNNWVEFKNGEDPRKSRSVHAWFFKNGKCVNHYILQSAYILSEYTLKK